MPGTKIATLGGPFTPARLLAQEILRNGRSLDLAEWSFHDSDARRLDTVAEAVEPLVREAGNPFRFRLSANRDEALSEADFVLAWADTGGEAALREDRLLCSRWRQAGQETGGVTAMACALRNIPPLLSVADAMRRCCPDAWMISTGEPAGMLVEALQRRVPGVRTVGLSNGPVGYQAMTAELLGLDDHHEVFLDYVGLNHLAWVRGARVGGRDVWRTVVGDQLGTGTRDFVVRLGMVWDYYLNDYRRDTRGAAAGRSDKDSWHDVDDPAEDNRTGPHLVDAALLLVRTTLLDTGGTQIVNTRHNGALEDVPADWVLELPCRISRHRAEPLRARPLPVFAAGLLRIVKSFELLVVEAACTGDRSAAMAALIAHPLGPDVDHAMEVLEDMLETHRPFLPQFHKDT